jgi:hypothetical protein
MKAFENSKDFPQIPAGVYLARLVRLIDMGTQPDTMYGGTKRQVFLGFETPSCHREWEDKTQGQIMREPFIVGAFFTLSMGTKSNLRKFIENWFGKEIPQEAIDKGFDMKVLMDQVAQISVIHKAKARGTGTRADISTIMPVPKEIKENFHSRVTSLIYFSLDNDEFSMGVYNGLPKYFQEEVKKSEEWAVLNGSRPSGDTQLAGGVSPSDVGKGFDDDIPF